MPLNTKELQSILSIFQSSQDLIEYDYKGNENQILISKNLIDTVNLFLNGLDIKDKSIKELLKVSIRSAFELLDTDIVLSKDGHIFIKLLQNLKKIPMKEEDKGTIRNRYNGISKDELQSFHDEFFTNTQNKNFFRSIANKFVEIYFHTNQINNNEYEKNVFSYIQKITLEQLHETYEEDSDHFFEGLAGFIFRIHFKEVFEYIADSILDDISMANSHMIKFLKYYSQSIIVEGGMKYKVPNIEADDGLRWNVVSMLSIAKIYTQTIKSLHLLQVSMVKQEQEIRKLYLGSLSPIEYQASYLKKQQSLENKISNTNIKLDKYRDALEFSNDEDKRDDIKIGIMDLKNVLASFKAEKIQLSKKMLKQSIILKYTNLQKELDSAKREFIREQHIISRNQNAYLSMRDSLVKALISKKQVLQLQ